MLSGWLSMDLGRIFSTTEMTDAEADACSGMPVLEPAKPVAPEMIRSLLPAAEIEVSALNGTSYLIARGGDQAPRLAAVSGPGSCGTDRAQI